MASPSHSPLITSSAVTPPPPQPPPSHSEADRENATLPYTPTSSATSAESPTQTPASRHRKASSLSSPQQAAKKRVGSRSLSLRRSQVQVLTEEQLKILTPESGVQEKLEGTMITPPQNLPPSPPLTSQDTEGDADLDADLDTEEAADGVPRGEREQEAGVAEGWQGRGKRSMEVSEHEHPLSPSKAGFEGFSGDAGADVDLEKGRDVSHAHEDEDFPDPVGVTKPFEVIRRPKRQSSPKPPHSSYYVGPPTGSTAFYTAPRGQIGVHHPREIVRIERDYDHGELVQFSSSYPLELQGRITPTQFLETINALNEGLIRAHSLSGAFIDNTLAILTLWLSPLVLESKYEREMKRLRRLVDSLNAELYNPQGLNILWPRKSAFLFLEIEYY